jgi:cell division protein ZapA (FtsZ GTPase activity inhibitor)
VKDERGSCSVRIRGQEFRIRSDDDPEALQRIAETVDATMTKIEERTGAIDSLDVAMLTSLNLARELVELRGNAPPRVSDARLRDLIDRAEAAVAESA